MYRLHGLKKEKIVDQAASIFGLSIGRALGLLYSPQKIDHGKNI
ncbi:MAG: hypothetical protein QXH32_02090 [Candidatus Caldarchaeum sp.]